MGCGASTEAVPVTTGGPTRSAVPAAAPSPFEAPANPRRPDDPKEVNQSNGIDRDLDRARQQEELKVKLLLLGAGESGKSTIFKQMRIIYGTPRDDDDLRMYGVVVRSNIITAMRKLCMHLHCLGLEDQLAAEPAQEGETMTPKEAYDLVYDRLIERKAPAEEDMEMPTSNGNDWVGTSPKAGLPANNDAKQFLQIWKPIKALWEVRAWCCNLLL